MAKDSASINLLNNNKSNAVGQVINWALTIGRTLIIVTEIIALTVFIYRFILDGQLQTLQTKIKQEQTIIQSQQKNEETYRNLQDRLAVAAQFGRLGAQNTKIFQSIVGLAPNGMSFTNAALSQNRMQIEANVISVDPLSIFIDKLKANPQVDSISIDKIENKTASAVITVGLSITLKQGGGNAITGN